jgi:hypothetical protein
MRQKQQLCAKTHALPVRASSLGMLGFLASAQPTNICNGYSAKICNGALITGVSKATGKLTAYRRCAENFILVRLFMHYGFFEL